VYDGQRGMLMSGKKAVVVYTQDDKKVVI